MYSIYWKKTAYQWTHGFQSMWGGDDKGQPVPSPQPQPPVSASPYGTGLGSCSGSGLPPALDPEGSVSVSHSHRRTLRDWVRELHQAKEIPL